MRFTNKVVIVTGGATGIGREAAIRYGREGASVTVADINAEEAAETVRQVAAAGGKAIFVRTDVTCSTEVQAMVAATVSEFGRLDAAFNNAGTPGGFTSVADCTEEEWQHTLALNLTSVFLCMKHEIAAMLAAGNGGAIVNTASEAANHPAPHMASYVATKAGVVGLTRSAAYDFAERGIRVNALLPGPTVTPMLLRGTQGLDRSIEVFGEHLPMRRVGQSGEQADAVLFLTSDESSFITGQALSVDGGLNLGRRN